MNAATAPVPKIFESATILIVDDNRVNLKIATKFLEKSGIKVLATRNPKIGLQQAKEAKPDIILLDIVMPEMDGFEACSLLKEDLDTKHIPVIFMTSLSQIDDKIKAFNAGGVDYLTKPLEEKELLARVKAQLQLQSLTKKLQESEASYRLLAELSPVGVFHFNLEGKCTYANQKGIRLTGLNLEDMMLRYFDSICPCWSQFIEGIKLQQQVLEQQEWSQECQFQRPDGTRIWVLLQIVLSKDFQGKHTGFIVSMTDISDRKLYEEKLANNLAQEKEITQLKSRFISMTSHEFRTPLAVISSSVGIMKKFGHKLSEEKKQAHFQTIEKYIQHTTRLLDDILMINSAEAGEIKLNPEAIDLYSFCQNLVAEMQMSSDRHQILFTCHSQTSDLIQVSLDLKLLREILTNLLSNAIKYSPDGGEVNLDLTMKPEKVIFQVKDGGIGIPTSDEEKLFEHFHRASNVGTIQGTGLGLSIVKQCVDLHGGQITVQSQVGQGTTFTVTLPVSS